MLLPSLSKALMWYTLSHTCKSPCLGLLKEKAQFLLPWTYHTNEQNTNWRKKYRVKWGKSWHVAISLCFPRPWMQVIPFLGFDTGYSRPLLQLTVRVYRFLSLALTAIKQPTKLFVRLTTLRIKGHWCILNPTIGRNGKVWYWCLTDFFTRFTCIRGWRRWRAVTRGETERESSYERLVRSQKACLSTAT